jgi:hypothetical protein
MSEVERLALNAFLGFRSFFADGGDSLEQASPGALDDELFYWQSRFETQKEPEARKAQWHKAYKEYQESDAYDKMMMSGVLRLLQKA